MPNKFVYTTQPINQGNVSIKQYEVGILNNCCNGNSEVRFISQDHSISIPSNIILEFDPSKTGDQYNKKICNVCNRLLSIDYFQKNQNGKNNRTVRRPSCNDCRDIIDGVGVSTSDKRKWEPLKPQFIVWECPICKKRTIPGLTSKVVLDHNHLTGKPRAWICDSCNTGLGRFKDNIELMQNAIKYLRTHEDSSNIEP